MTHSCTVNKDQSGHRLLAYTIAAASTLAAAEVYAQETRGSTRASVLEEVVVTARRRAESIQDVPIHISALDSAALDRMKISQPEDLELVVPSFMMGGNSKDSFQPSIRGQSIYDTLGTTDAPVNV